jgi:Ca2+-binding EF-hand superfamily protein
VVQSLIATFSSQDWDGDGALSSGEFTANLRVMKGAGERMFRSVDRNRNREISLEEFAAYRGVRLPAGTKAPVDAVKGEFRRLDANRDGSISIEEIGIAMTFQSADDLDAYFAQLDRNRNGGVSLEEWRKANRNPNASDPAPCPGSKPATYIGKTLDQVRALVGEANVRVVRLDGEEFLGTTDYIPCRLNVIVEQGVVTGAHGG